MANAVAEREAYGPDKVPGGHSRTPKVAVGPRADRSMRWLGLVIVTVLFLVSFGLFVAGGEAQAQETVEAPDGGSQPAAEPEPAPERLTSSDAGESEPTQDPASPDSTATQTATTPEPDPTATGTISEPAPTDPVVTEPEPEPAPEPAPADEPLPDPITEPAPEPIAEPTPEPVPQPLPEPVVSQPAPDPVPQPTAEPAPEPVISQPVPEQPVPEQPTPEPASTDSALPEPAPAVAPVVPSEMSAAAPSTGSEQGLAAEPVAMSFKLSEDPVTEETYEQQPVPDAAVSGTVVEHPKHHSAPPENIMGRITSDLTQRVGELLASLPNQTAEMSGWIGNVADRMAQAVSKVLGGLLGSGNEAPNPVDEPLIPSVPLPAAPPPVPPVPVGGPSFASGSSSGWSISSASDHEKLLQQFAILILFSIVLLKGGEYRWITREPLAPSLLARPPNERPG